MVSNTSPRQPHRYRYLEPNAKSFAPENDLFDGQKEAAPQISLQRLSGSLNLWNADRSMGPVSSVRVTVCSRLHSLPTG
jgi:hypothetical protein